MKVDVLKKVFPALTLLMYEDYGDYCNQTPDVIYELQSFNLQGTLIVNHENVVVNVE